MVRLSKWSTKTSSQAVSERAGRRAINDRALILAVGLNRWRMVAAVAVLNYSPAESSKESRR